MISWWQLAFIVVLALALFVTVFKRVHSRLFWEILFTLTVFLGVWFLLLFILPLGWALAAASALTLAEVFFPYVFVHDLFYLVGCVGVAVNFAGWLGPDVLLFGLVLFVVYDTVAGPPGGMVEVLAAKLVKAGVIPGLVIPGKIRGLATTLDEAVKSDAALLGAGDLILPLALVAKASFRGPLEGGVIVAGMLVGAVILGRISDGHPRAALPILAVGSAVPFVLLRAIGLV